MEELEPRPWPPYKKIDLCQKQIDFLKELVYYIRDSRIPDQDIKPYIREKLIQFEGNNY